MFGSIVVGTDGSETATEAVRQAIDLAKETGARLEVVSAYAPVPVSRLRSEASDAPSDVQWMINEREDVEATLASVVTQAAAIGVAEDGGLLHLNRPPDRRRSKLASAA